MKASPIAGVFLIALLQSLGAQAPAASAPIKPIQDNSFLLEEAYNQEAAVVQHINTLFFDRTIRAWQYALTDEWPLNGQRHQLSITIPLQSGASGGSAGLGDIALNYRLQLVGSGETRLAVTPRFTVHLPTASRALGGGTLGYQGAIASSFAAVDRLVFHTNAGVALFPKVAAGSGGSGTLVDVSAAQSVIWLAHPRLNFMLEGTVASIQEFTGIGTGRARSTGITMAPGLRWAYNFPSGLQVVPGIAFPLGFQANDGQRGVFLYLSLEHDMPGLRR